MEKFKRKQTGGLLSDIAVAKIGGLKEGGWQLKLKGFHTHNLA
jgi:hypothetical protein